MTSPTSGRTRRIVLRRTVGARPEIGVDLCLRRERATTQSEIYNLKSTISNLSDYQSNLIPTRAILGPIIVDGCSNEEPEAQAILEAALLFPRL
jgi:hypothetical protein